MTRPLIVATGAATHSGLRRPLNEDSYMASPPLFLVADGMGGHEAGERASATVIDEFARYIGRVDLELEDLLEALARARSAVEALSTDGSGRAGTTLSGVVVASVEGMGYWLTVNIGDSRTYRLADGELEQISVDHSVVRSSSNRASSPRRRRPRIAVATSSRGRSAPAAPATPTTGCSLRSSVIGCSSAPTV